MEIQIDCTEKNDNYNIKSIAEAMRIAKDITIEQYYNKETALVKDGITNNTTHLEGIVVSVNKYSEYKFLIGEKCQIIGVLEGEVTNTTNKGDFTDISEFENNNGKNIPNEEKYIKTRYLLIEVNGYLENEDGATINELEIYNKELQKCPYTVINELEYDTSRDGKSEYWEDMRYWNYTNLYDGLTEYTSNASGNQNCTLFLYNGSNASNNYWARFIIDLGEELEIEQIRMFVGGYDELSPCKSRVPKEVTFYSIDNFQEGTEGNTTYANNIIQRNDNGLTKIAEIEFKEPLLTVEPFEIIDRNYKYNKARYMIFEIDGYIDGGQATLNEIEIYNQYKEKINYKVLNELEYDTSRDGKSDYWENMSYWNYTNLNDGATIYTSNSLGGQNCTLFLDNDSNQNENYWARFIIDLGEEIYVRDINIWIGNVERRMPRTINIYSVNNFVDGTGENTTYSNNIAQKNNEGLNLITTKTFEEVLTTATELKFLN